MSRVKVKKIFEKDTENPTANPILINFQHTRGIQTCHDVNETFKTAVYTNIGEYPEKEFAHLNRARDSGGGRINGIAQKDRMLVALQSNDMTYIGESDESDPMRTYYAVKKGKKLLIYEVTPITVAPFITGHSHVVEKEKETHVKKNKAEKRAAAVDLVKSFGSKKKRLTYERNEKNKIAVSDMNESMTKASAQIDAPEEEPLVKDDSILTLIPPCNREALSPAGVYKIDDILSMDDMENMEELAEQFLNLSADVVKQWHSAKKFSDYFFAMWHELSSRKGELSVVQTAKLVLYTELLISLLKLRHEQIRKKVLDLPDVFPQWLQEKAIEEFTMLNAKGMRNRPEAVKDKTCCYIMVLVLIANGFVLDIQLMSTSLNIHIKKLLTLAKAVGVTINYNSTSKEYRGVLRLPLPKQIETRGRRRTLR